MAPYNCKIVAEVGVISFEGEGRSPEPGSAGGLYKPEKVRSGFSSGPSRRNAALRTPSF